MSLVSTVNLHDLTLDEVGVNVINTTTWVTLGPVSIFGQGDTPSESLDYLRNIFSLILAEIETKELD